MTSKHRAARTTSRPASNAMIALESVELTLPPAAGPVHILRGLLLLVEPGATASVVGPSGPGTSSMMNIIAGLEPARKGVVNVGGTSFTVVYGDCLSWSRHTTLLTEFMVSH